MQAVLLQPPPQEVPHTAFGAESFSFSSPSLAALGCKVFFFL